MRRASGRAAFTLVELLVVIGIIAVLIAILLPVLTKARQQAMLTACLANQRTIGQAAAVYMTESQGWLPRDGFSMSPSGYWPPWFWQGLGVPRPDDSIMTVSGHTGFRVHVDIDYCIEWLQPLRVFKCPALPESEWVIHYIVNSQDFERFERDGRYSERQWQKVTKMRRPDTVAYIVEVNMTTLGALSLGSHNIWRPEDLPFYTSPDARAGQPILSGNRMISSIDMRHQGRTTVCFFDGHAEVRRLTPGHWPRSILNPLAD